MKNNESKFNQALKKIGDFLIILMPIFSISYYDYPAQLNDHLYYLAYSQNPTFSPTLFTFYECKLDNTSCERLPIQYTGFGYLRETTADETTGEISVFIDDEFEQKTLIFTWGENPRCYVEGCEIFVESE